MVLEPTLNQPSGTRTGGWYHPVLYSYRTGGTRLVSYRYGPQAGVIDVLGCQDFDFCRHQFGTPGSQESELKDILTFLSIITVGPDIVDSWSDVSYKDKHRSTIENAYASELITNFVFRLNQHLFAHFNNRTEVLIFLCMTSVYLSQFVEIYGLNTKNPKFLSRRTISLR